MSEAQEELLYGTATHEMTEEIILATQNHAPVSEEINHHIEFQNATNQNDARHKKDYKTVEVEQKVDNKFYPQTMVGEKTGEVTINYDEDIVKKDNFDFTSVDKNHFGTVVNNPNDQQNSSGDQNYLHDLLDRNVKISRQFNDESRVETTAGNETGSEEIVVERNISETMFRGQMDHEKTVDDQNEVKIIIDSQQNAHITLLYDNKVNGANNKTHEEDDKQLIRLSESKILEIRGTIGEIERDYSETNEKVDKNNHDNNNYAKQNSSSHIWKKRELEGGLSTTKELEAESTENKIGREKYESVSNSLLISNEFESEENKVLADKELQAQDIDIIVEGERNENQKEIHKKLDTYLTTEKNVVNGSSTMKQLETNSTKLKQIENSNLIMSSSPLFTKKEKEAGKCISADEELKVSHKIETSEIKCCDCQNEPNVVRSNIENFKTDKGDNVSCEKKNTEIGSLTTKEIKENAIENLKTKYLTPKLDSPLSKIQNGDDEFIIGLSAAEELEICEIIERAEREYAKNYDVCDQGKNDSIMEKEVEGFCMKKDNIDDTQTTKRDHVNVNVLSDYKISTENRITTIDNTIRNNKVENESNKNHTKYKRVEESQWDREHATKYGMFYSCDERENYNCRMSNSNEASPNSGNNRSELITFEDKELIRELVAIALGEIHVSYLTQHSDKDRRGQIIKEFVKEYFDELAKARKYDGLRNRNHTSSTECRDYEKTLSKSTDTKYNVENLGVLISTKGKVNRNIDDRPDVIPRLLPIGDNCHLYRRKLSDEAVRNGRDTSILKWESDVDEYACKSVGGQSVTSSEGSPRTEDYDWLKVQTERKSTFSLKHLPMNERNGNFFVDRTLVPVDLYQDGLMVHQWNPTSVLNEICAKSGWTLPRFTIVNSNDDGYLVSVNVNGQEFFPRQRGETRRAARHLASAHFLKCLGFRYEFEPSTTRNKNDEHGRSATQRRSASSESRKHQENDGECRSSQHTSRWCQFDTRRRSVSCEDNARERQKGIGDHTLRSRGGADYQHRSPSPTTVYSTKKRENPLMLQSPKPKNKERPPTWDKVDEIPPFVPRQSHGRPRALLPTPRSPAEPYKCRCKLSFPHPSIHPWRYQMSSSRQQLNNFRRDYYY